MRDDSPDGAACAIFSHDDDSNAGPAASALAEGSTSYHFTAIDFRRARQVPGEIYYFMPILIASITPLV